MTGSLRASARNPIGIALMGILILVFLILGVGGGGRFPDAFRANRADAVVAAGSRSVSSRAFRRIFEQQKSRFEEQTHQTYPVEALVANGFDQQLLNALALDQAFTEMLARAGVQPGPSLVDAEIRKLPFAFDRITGQFSEKQFTQVLAAQGLTPREAQAEIADELAQRHFAYALEAGFQAPRLYAALSAMTGLESRDISYFVLNPRTVPQPAAPTDAELTMFMKEHARQLMRPETRVITLVSFSAKALAPGISVDPAAVEKAFEARKDSLSTPERRTVVQVPVKTAQQAATAAARLAKGEDAKAVARSMGSEAVVYVDQPITAIADRKLAAAAFALKPGEVSGLVQGDLGAAVLQVVKVTPGAQATLQSARGKVEADLRAKAAADQAYQLSQKFDDARQAGAGVAEAARKAGVTPITLGPIDAKGQDGQGKTNPLLSEAILKSAFSRAAGEESDIQDAGPGEYYALKVERVTPPAPPPLAEIKPQLTQAYISEKFIQALKAKAEVLMDLIRNGEPMEKAAAQVGAQVARQADMQRIHADNFKSMGRDFLIGVFSAKRGDVFAATAPGGVFIARLEAVRPGDPTATARLLEGLRGEVTQVYVRDIEASAKAASRQQVKVSINLGLARQALGVDPAELPKPGAARGGGAR